MSKRDYKEFQFELLFSNQEADKLVFTNNCTQIKTAIFFLVPKVNILERERSRLRPVYTASGTAARHGITARQKIFPVYTAHGTTKNVVF